MGEHTDLFFVMGFDSWSEITTWRDWERLRKLANLIVVTRPGFEFSVTEVGSDVAETIVDVRGANYGAASRSTLDQPKIFITDAVKRDISATAVRQAARGSRFEELEKMVPREVAEYIRKYRLYKNKNE
jgi:nicotinate-nucleotide adenylyltransferase